MSLTDQERMKIHEIASRLNGKIANAFPDSDGGSDSYFRDRIDLKLFERPMFEYAFETPMELMGELEGMWKYQDADFMRDFMAVCTAAAFKCRHAPADEEGAKGISAFIYEF
jgi:hypothetical protein